MSEWAIQLIIILKNIHQDCHLIHADIKPSNIGLDLEGKLYLFDFGSSIDIGLPPHNNLVGTLAYMSTHSHQPELLRGNYKFQMDLQPIAFIVEEINQKKLPWRDHTDNIELVYKMKRDFLPIDIKVQKFWNYLINLDPGVSIDYSYLIEIFN